MGRKNRRKKIYISERKIHIMERMGIRRGDIYYADLNPIIGSEQGGQRPVLVVSNNQGNLYSNTVIIIPITSRVDTKAWLPTHTELYNIDCLSEERNLALAEQIRTIDKQRLHDYVGRLPYGAMLRVERSIAASLGMN